MSYFFGNNAIIEPLRHTPQTPLAGFRRVSSVRSGASLTGTRSYIAQSSTLKYIEIDEPENKRERCASTAHHSKRGGLCTGSRGTAGSCARRTAAAAAPHRAWCKSVSRSAVGRAASRHAAWWVCESSSGLPRGWPPRACRGHARPCAGRRRRARPRSPGRRLGHRPSRAQALRCPQHRATGTWRRWRGQHAP
eukprot:scaffold71571_cov66-Phaeocystis_antarctica.AAC.4